MCWKFTPIDLNRIHIDWNRILVIIVGIVIGIVIYIHCHIYKLWYAWLPTTKYYTGFLRGVHLILDVETKV